MKASWTGGLLLALAVGLVAGLMISHRVAPAAARDEDRPQISSEPGRFRVVESEFRNLIVTDNKTNTLYFYTIDKGKEPGDELKLRGSIDLNQVGQPVLKPRTHKVDK